MESVYPSLTSLKKLFVFLRKLSTAMLGDEDKMFRLSQKGLCSTICYASMVILMLTRLEKSNICNWPLKVKLKLYPYFWSKFCYLRHSVIISTLLNRYKILT